MKVTEHVAYQEVVRSDCAKRRGIKNVPTPEQTDRIKILCGKVFEPLRVHLGVPIFLSSVFRSPELNRALSGAKNSQHLANSGAAFDLDAQVFGDTTNKEIGDYIRKNLEWDQLIYEDWDVYHNDHAWIHCSYKEDGNRKEVLIMERINGKITYRVF